MKKLILTDIQAGVRKLGNVKALYEHIEAAYVDALSDITKGLVDSSSSYIVLRGCVNSGSGSTYTISAGAILKSGEIYSVPAFSGTASGGDVPRLELVETKVQLQYSDNTNRDTLNTRTFAWVFGTTGTGLVDFSAVVSLSDVVNSMLDVSGQITAALVAKSDKANPAWTNLTLINGWTSSGLNAAAYRITDQGILHIRGQLSSASATNQVFANLPNGTLASSHEIGFVVTQASDSIFANMVLSGGSPSTLQISTGYATSKLYNISVMIPLDADY